MKIAKPLLLVPLLLAATACGNKGPLYLPQKPVPAQDPLPPPPEPSATATETNPVTTDASTKPSAEPPKRPVPR